MSEKQQQIVQMAKDICRYQPCCNDVCKPISACDALKYAERAVEAGYSKQREGEWKYNPDGMDWGLGAWQCSLCGCNNHNLPMDNRVNPMRFAGAKYCPHCGAKMKGGE